jgi:hypothetical protein
MKVHYDAALNNISRQYHPNKAKNLILLSEIEMDIYEAHVILHIIQRTHMVVCLCLTKPNDAVKLHKNEMPTRELFLPFLLISRHTNEFRLAAVI